MHEKVTDPFGGIRGQKIVDKPDLSKLPPLEIDHLEALNGIKRSIELWDGVGDLRPKGTLRERVRQKREAAKEIPANWNYISEFNKDFADIHLKWSGEKVRSIKHVPASNVRVALVGLSAFYKNFQTVDPDLSHPDILKCVNLTAKNFDAELTPIPDDLQFNPEKHLDPFAGIKGKDALRLSEFNKDLKKALDEVSFSIEYIDQIDVPIIARSSSLQKENQKIWSKRIRHQFLILMFLFGGLAVRFKKLKMFRPNALAWRSRLLRAYWRG